MTITTTSVATAGDALRAARREAGLTRIQLAALADVSFSQLSNIEQGAVPKRSGVLERAFAAIAALNENDPAGNRAVQKGGVRGTARHQD